MKLKALRMETLEEDDHDDDDDDNEDCTLCEDESPKSRGISDFVDPFIFTDAALNPLSPYPTVSLP